MSDIKALFSKEEDIDSAITDFEENTGNSFTKKTYIKLEEGETGNKLRILPPLEGQKAPWHHIRIHFNLVGPSGKKFPVQCGMANLAKCPFCAESVLYREQGDKNKSWGAAAKDQFLYNVIDEKGEFSVLTADKKLQGELIKAFKFALSEDGGKYRPWDVADGCFVKIVKTKGKKADGQKFAPNIYAVHLLPKKELSEDVLSRVEESAADLPKIYREFTVEEMRGMLDGTFNPFEKRTDGSYTTEKTPDVDYVPSPEANKTEKTESLDDVIANAKKTTKKMLEGAL